MSNLKQIALGVKMYQQDYRKESPDEFRRLWPQYVSAGKTFKCPGDKTISEVDMARIQLDTKISYVYIKGITAKNWDDPRMVQVYDASPDNHNGEGRNVMFVTGRVEWLSEAAFRDALRQTLNKYPQDTP